MAKSTPTFDSLVARRVSRGPRADESAQLLQELIDTTSRANLVSALVYQHFATVAQAQLFAASLPEPAR